MDMQKSAASRVRHILQAMEKSIDTARVRRVNGSTADSDATNPMIGGRGVDDARTIPSRPALNAQGGPRPNAIPGAAAQGNPQQGAQGGQPRNPLIGGSPLIGGQGGAGVPQPAVSPDQPQRLKARPKRFESTFAAQYAQPPYRTQAG